MGWIGIDCLSWLGSGRALHGGFLILLSVVENHFEFDVGWIFGHYGFGLEHRVKGMR